MLRLNPLSYEASTELLSSKMEPEDVQEFLDRARDLGFAALGNPWTLILLVEAAPGEIWPTSRRETFEMACKVMAVEQNDEHQAGAGVLPTETLMDAAGFLCALQLLSDVDGVSLAHTTDSSSFLSLSEIEEVASEPSHDNLTRALSTRLFTGLFTGAGEQNLNPVHRQVSEFLGGRYLAKLVADGLPAQRVVALMTGPSDDRVVTALRGLSAWLAAHSPEARQHLIDADPVGLGLYGDIQQFAAKDKERLLRSLAMFATREPLLGHEYGTARAFRSLASADMASSIKGLLNDTEAQQDRIVEFVLEVLAEADESELDSPAGLASDLEPILFDTASSPRVRTAALDAYIRLVPCSDTKTDKLTQLLDQAHNRTLPDPDDELRGTLLEFLYPTYLPPSLVWQYILLRNQPNFYGRFGRFWQYTLLENSSDQHIAALLDAFHEDASRLKPALSEPRFMGLLLELVARGLESRGEALEPSRRYIWLDATGQSLRNSPLNEQSALRVQAWLEAHPQVQKDVFLTWLRRRDPNDLRWLAGYWRCNVLHKSTLPADFGLWCLEQAIEIGDTEPAISQDLLWRTHHSLQDPSINEGLTLEILRDRTRGHDKLAQQLDELCRPIPKTEELDTFEREERDWLAEHEAKERQLRADWESHLRSNQAELRENRFLPNNLWTLAKVYFGLLPGIDPDVSPDRRISDFIGGDTNLVDAVLSALNGAIRRDDVPEAAETISLRSESKQSWLADPVLASLSLHHDDPAELDDLDDSQKRNALAIYYCLHANSGYNGASQCHDRWLDQDPGLVLNTLYRCAISAIRAGEEHPSGLDDLDRIVGHDDDVNDVRLRLLNAYPTRGSGKQLPVLDRLLAKLWERPDKAALEALVTQKLSSTSMTVAQRVRWLTISSLISPCQRRQEWREYVGQNEKRVTHLAEFLRNSSNRHRSAGSNVTSCSDPETLRDLIKMLGIWYGPRNANGLVTLGIDASDQISELIDELSSHATNKALRALTELIDDPQLERWRYKLTWARVRQSVALRDASYAHPTVRQVQCTVRNLVPANAADLLALVNDRLSDVSLELRGSNSNLWRQFWNEGPHRNPAEPKHEESCRDALLAALQIRLPSEVDAAPEGRYVSDKRADIRVSFGGFNVPIEIKKNSHADLWNALRNQLITQYTTDPYTSGHGIYLVLWFGADKTTRPPDGNRPATTDELQQRLEADLTLDETRKVSVIVIDVTKPGNQ